MFERNSLSDKILFLKFGLLNLILFLLVYVPTNNLPHETYFQPYFLWELQTQRIDWMIIPYHSFNLLFLIPLFLLRGRHIKILGVSFFLTTVIAGLFFIIFPTQLGFVRIVPEGFFTFFYEYLYKLDNTTNLVPSLHVTYVTLYFISCVPFLMRKLSKMLFTLFTLIIISSTFFTHQHHIVDIVSGILLASSVYWFVSYKLFRENSRHQQ